MDFKAALKSNEQEQEQDHETNERSEGVVLRENDGGISARSGSDAECGTSWARCTTEHRAA